MKEQAKKLIDAMQGIKDSDNKTLIVAGAILALLTLFFLISYVPLLAAYGLWGLVALLIFAFLAGIGVASQYFDQDSRIRLLNILFKGRNYHNVYMIQSGKRINSWVKRVEQPEGIQINDNLHAINQNAVYLKKGAPTIFFNEKTLQAIDFEEEVNPRQDPSIFNALVMMYEQRSEKRAAKQKKLMEMLTFGILLVAIIGAIFGFLTFQKLDSLTNVLLQVVQQGA